MLTLYQNYIYVDGRIDKDEAIITYTFNAQKSQHTVEFLC